MGVARDNYPRVGATYSFVAGFAEVEVDVETGHYRILDFLAVADVGTVLHPRGLAGQLHGGAVQGFGHVRSQRLVYDTHYGTALATRMYNNKPPTDSRHSARDEVGGGGHSGSAVARRRQGRRRAVYRGGRRRADVRARRVRSATTSSAARRSCPR